MMKMSLISRSWSLNLFGIWCVYIDGGKDLGVQTITIFDGKGGKIFSTPVDRAEWAKPMQ